MISVHPVHTNTCKCSISTSSFDRVAPTSAAADRHLVVLADLFDIATRSRYSGEMPRKCSVISCSSLKGNSDVTLFKAPTCSLDSWKEVIYRVNGGDKRKVTFVCSKHFTSDDLITSYISMPKDVEDFVGKRNRYGLKKGAIPSIFNYSIDTSKTNCTTTDSLKHNTELSDSVNEKLNNQNCTTPLLQHDDQKAQNKNVIPSIDTCKINITLDSPKSSKHYAPAEPQREQACTTVTVQKQLEGFKELLLSIGWLFYSDGFTISMYKPVKTESGGVRIVVEKQIVFQSNTLDIAYYVNQKRIHPEVLGLQQLTYPLDTAKVTDTIKVFHCKQICQGGPCIDEFPGIRVKTTHLEDGKIWYHNKCSIVTQSKKRCNKCNFVIKYFRICKRRSLQKNKSCVQSTLNTTKYVEKNEKTKNDMENFEEPIEIDLL